MKKSLFPVGETRDLATAKIHAPGKDPRSGSLWQFAAKGTRLKVISGDACFYRSVRQDDRGLRPLVSGLWVLDRSYRAR